MSRPEADDGYHRASRSRQRGQLCRRACGPGAPPSEHHRPGRQRSQPIYNEDRTLVITYNGEIYNYQPLREELLALGHTFATEGDTEVILHGYEQWGADVLKRLRGMFAFVIWDTKTRTLFGARDHFGIKPFYYAQMNGTFMYASEIKASRNSTRTRSSRI